MFSAPQVDEFPKPGFLSKDFCQEPVKRTQQPTVTGTSVIGCKYNGGVIIASDTLGSYGSMARFRGISRICKYNDSCVVAGAGDIADFQHIQSMLEGMSHEELIRDDGYQKSPQEIYSYLTRLMYQRRSKMNPLWNTLMVAGFKNGKPFLGQVDKLGIAYEAPTISSGFGSYLAEPLLRVESEKDDFDYDKARAVIEECLKVLYYRDARSFNRYEIVVINKNGVTIEQPKAVPTNWDVAHCVKGY